MALMLMGMALGGGGAAARPATNSTGTAEIFRIDTNINSLL